MLIVLTLIGLLTDRRANRADGCSRLLLGDGELSLLLMPTNVEINRRRGRLRQRLL